MIKNMSKFSDSLVRPYERIAQWKEDNNKLVVGCLPMYFPEELVHASGAVPFVMQESDELITLGSRHIDSFFCRFVRSVVDLAAKGKLDFLDLLIVPDTCVQQRGMAQVMRHLRTNIPVELIQFPIQIGVDSAVNHARQCLEKVRVRLQQLTGNEVSDGQIAKSILVHKENRALLKRVYQLRKERPGLLRGRDVMEIVQSSMVMPKEEHSEHLKVLLAELEEPQASTGERVRLCISGHLCSAPKVDVLDLIEEMGAVIVDDDLYTGFRYFAEEREDKGSPMEQLARRYVYRTVPCPTRFDPGNDWRSYLVNMAKKAQAQGIIVLIQRHCEPHLTWYPDIKDALSAAKIRCLMIETEHEAFSLGEEKTRIQKLVETIRG